RRRVGRHRRPAPHREPRAREVHALPARRADPRRVRLRRDRGRARSVASAAPHRRRLPRGDAGPHGAPALRPLHERGADLRRRLPAAALPTLADRLAPLGAVCQFLAAADTRDRSGDFTLACAFAPPALRPRALALVSVDAADARFPSLATRSFAASRFEREIRDLFGLTPRGHPDPRRLALHQFWPEGYHPLRRDAAMRGEFADAGQPFPFRRVEGEGIFEITVGPVHAGIIEPGHFRFSVEGETIVNLETRLGFVHKGTEKLFETL